MRPHTVVIIDDHPIVIRGIRQLLESSEDFDVVGEGASGGDALELVDAEHPNIVILDLRLPDSLGPDVCRQLLERNPSPKVVILTAFDDPEILWACLDIGASGILLKGAFELDLIKALREVSAGSVVIDNSVSRVLEDTNSLLRDEQGQIYGELRPREYEVLRLLAQGMSTKQIAATLGLRVNTVRSYTQALMEKLDAHNRVQLVVTARQLRLI